MDARDNPTRNASGPAPNAGGPAPSAPGPHRHNPLLWALLPIMALLVLGAYMLGTRMNGAGDDDAGLTATEQAPPMPPPPPPKGSITVTELPAAPAPPPVQPRPAPPRPAVNPAPAPKPKLETPYRQEEPPFVLTPPEPEPADPAGEILPPEPPGEDMERPARPVENPEPDREPVSLNNPALEYPTSAYEAGVQGSARVSFTVTAEGRVTDASVSQSSGDSRLDQAALDYVQRLRFRPAVRNGRVSDVRANRTVNFRLD